MLLIVVPGMGRNLLKHELYKVPIGKVLGDRVRTRAVEYIVPL